MATAMAMAVAIATAAATARPYSCKPVGGLTRPVSGLLMHIYGGSCIFMVAMAGILMTVTVTITMTATMTMMMADVLPPTCI